MVFPVVPKLLGLRMGQVGLVAGGGDDWVVLLLSTLVGAGQSSHRSGETVALGTQHEFDLSRLLQFESSLEVLCRLLPSKGRSRKGRSEASRAPRAPCS